MPAVAARLHQLEEMGRLKKHVVASRSNGSAAKNKGKWVNDKKKLHPMLIRTWSLDGKSFTVKASKERKTKKGYAGYRDDEKIVFQEVLYASKFVRFGEFSEDSKSKCKTAHRSRWEDAGKKAREMMARCEGLNLDAKLARLEKRARSAKGVVKVQRGSAR